MQNLQKDLIQLLKDQDNLVIDGALNKNKIIEAALKVEPFLIKLLLANSTFKKHFFVDVEGVQVFDKIKFQRFVSNKSFLPDSYTAFKNKIGLAINDDTTDNYIKAKNDVVLAWPHKDCILEGGQTKEDQKRNEIFWNETLAPDNVDRLLDAKAFDNFKKYDKDGVHKINEIKGGENLILKGNNLLILSSLLKTHRGKIKLIYIDPPYNTGGDTFMYNDSFNHSAWLTFMKNRLVIAKELLKSDGVIFIQCDDNEQAYLKVLMDEVFGRDNFIACAPRKTGAGAAATNSKYALRKPYDFVLIHTKNKINTKFNKLIVGTKEYKLKDDYGKYSLGVFQPSGSDATRKRRPNLYYPIYLQNNGKLSLEKDNNTVKEILPDKYKGEDGRWMWKKEKFLADSDKYLYYDGNKIKRKIYYDQTQDQTKYQVEKAYFDESNYRNSVGTIELKTMFDKLVFNNPKPEFLLKKLIEIATNPGDLILDYNLGSGTTAAVSHKMKRKYIGIEQMDYVDTVTTERLRKVIEGEQGGISKDVNWKGGGSFVYAELMQYNQYFINKIQDAKTKDEIISIWREMQDKAFLSYQFDKDMFNERLEAFKTASLEQMQHYLIEVLDKNQLYVNYSEIEDENFKVSKEDKELNYSFYSKK